MSARRDIELPAMPGTRHHTALQLPLRQRSPGMRADPIQRVKRAVHIEDRNNPAAGNTLQAFARRHIGRQAEAVAGGHFGL